MALSSVDTGLALLHSVRTDSARSCNLEAVRSLYTIHTSVKENLKGGATAETAETHWSWIQHAGWKDRFEYNLNSVTSYGRVWVWYGGMLLIVVLDVVGDDHEGRFAISRLG